MAVLKSEIKRGFLRSLYRGTTVPPDTATLAEALATFQTNGFDALKSGRLVIASAGAGHQVSFALPMIGQQLAQDEVFALSEEFFAIYADASAGLTETNPGDNDATIFAAMMADDRMASITEVRQDYSLLRYPSYGPSR